MIISTAWAFPGLSIWRVGAGVVSKAALATHARFLKWGGLQESGVAEVGLDVPWGQFGKRVNVFKQLRKPEILTAFGESRGLFNNRVQGLGSRVQG